MKIQLWEITRIRRVLLESLGITKYSQPAAYNIDKKLLKYFHRPGFFVEAGAVDGVFESNTYYLERFKGWSGLLIEPSPSMFARIAKNRPRAKTMNCALVSSTYDKKTVTLLESYATSRIKRSKSEIVGYAREIEVPAYTLQSIFAEMNIQHIDLLSLDVEGYELQVLEGLDLPRVRPDYILIECLTEHAKSEIRSRLSDYYNFLEELSYRDLLFECKDK